ncbi:MAG: hypothetical protein AAGA08_08260 [Pseudomonadota bacterium]
MAHRYSDLTKIPADPLSRLMAIADLELSGEVDVPASADTEYVLRALDAAEKWDEVALVLAVALPNREAAWWSCLAARDYVKFKPKTPMNSIRAAEAWVFDPSDKTLADLETVIENNSPKDKSALCATAALYATGTMGSGEMAKIPAPPSAVALAVFGMNMLAMAEAEDPGTHMQWLIDRALDIARGGNGTIPCPKPIIDEDQDQDSDADDEAELAEEKS